MTDPCSYHASQALGRQMRQLDVEAFEVLACVGVLTPAAFASTPFDFQDWALEIRPDGVTFALFGLSQVFTLLWEQFLLEGRWLDPATSG